VVQENSKKRKRDKATEELEIDINLPEPPSKKALRRLKKGKSVSSQVPSSRDNQNSSNVPNEGRKTVKDEVRSEYSVWIGNLPWTITKSDLRYFLCTNANVDENHITRVYMPPPPSHIKPDPNAIIRTTNKGFAYVDFKTAEDMNAVIGVSEKLLAGRKVLIKNAKSYEGRPEKPSIEQTNGQSKPASKRVFVGNLGFDVTKENLTDHYTPCGEVVDIHLATFEDSGKCKGFAWVTFDSVEAGKAAVRGWTKIPVEEKDEGEGSDENDTETEEDADDAIEKKTKKKKKSRKWFVNKLKGRMLRCEFAEDAATRYKKRFGKEARAKLETSEGVGENGVGGEDGEADPGFLAAPSQSTHQMKRRSDKATNVERYHANREAQKVDARTIKPGAALANAHRASGAIVTGTGNKVTFD
ncbi:hypothetical protein M501DRAFT_912843, partial [Patellaria atrata CBS 101060]